MKLQYKRRFLSSHQFTSTPRYDYSYLTSIQNHVYVHVYISVQPFACYGYVPGKKISDANWKAGSFKYPGARGAVNNVPETRVRVSGWQEARKDARLQRFKYSLAARNRADRQTKKENRGCASVARRGKRKGETATERKGRERESETRGREGHRGRVE